MKNILFIIFSIIILSSCDAPYTGSKAINGKAPKPKDYPYWSWVQLNDVPRSAFINVERYSGFGTTAESALKDAMSQCESQKIKIEKQKNKSLWCVESALYTGYGKNYHSSVVAYNDELNRKKRESEQYVKNLERAKKQKQNQCKDLGFTEGTENFGMCILKLMEIEASLAKNSSDTAASQALANELKKKRQQEAGDALLGISESLLGGSSITETLSGKSSSGSSTSVSCYKTDETISGTNKICYYSCTGSTVTTNVGAAQQCPITINR